MLRFLVVPALALSLALAACGGGGDDDDDDNSSPDATNTPGSAAEPTNTAAASSSDPEPVRVPLEAGSSAETEGQDIGIVRITILEVIDSADDVSPLPVDEGMRLFAVRARAEALEAGDSAGNSGWWTLTTTDGEVYEWVGTASGEDLGYAEFPAGESREGIMAFLIPEDAKVESLHVEVSIYVVSDILFEA